MASVQERLQLRRMAVDKWSIREQLCLASAVACSGDQNWMSVSRSLKLLCGNDRPSDWFSQKSCAVQYGELLENVETPKRKKRTSDSGSTTVITETPTESILRKLTQERINELRITIQKEQEEYLKLREEILLLQNGSPTEEQLIEMWNQIEEEKEKKLIEQQKYSQFLKEREEKKIELQKIWRPGSLNVTQQQSIAGSVSQQQSSQTKPTQLNLNIKSVDIEGDDSNSSSSKPGTSPLLTSLLKSPSPAPSSSSSQNPSIVSNVRVTAPTITNLLTGNNTQIKQISTLSTTSLAVYNSAQNKPLTGPVPINPQPQIPPTTPSKSAPTLSMLLENKNKENLSIGTGTTIPDVKSTNLDTSLVDIKSETQNPQETNTTLEGDDSTNKDEDQQLMEVFNGLIPDNIDELADILTNNNAIILNPELLEEESILENVESLIDEEQEEEDKEKLKCENASKNISKPDLEHETKYQEQMTVEDPNMNDIETKVEIKEELVINENDGPVDEKISEKKINTDEKIQTEKEEKFKKENYCKEKELEDNLTKKLPEVENEVQSPEVSDDSSDNTTLQILKEKITTIEYKKIEESTEPQSDKTGQKSEKLEPEENSLYTEIKNTENEDIVMETQNENDKEIKENNSFIVEEKKDEFIKKEEHLNLENEVIEDKIEIIIEEQKKSSNESSIILIQEDEASVDTEKILEKPKGNQKKEIETKIKEEETKENNSLIQKEEKQTKLVEEESKDLESNIESLPSSSSLPINTTEIKSKSKLNTSKNSSNIENKSEIATTIVIDTDEESPVEIIREEITTRTKRDYSRKKTDATSSNSNSSSSISSITTLPAPTISIGEKRPVEDQPSSFNEEFKPNLTIKRLKERERSESPLVDDETIDSMPRTRRRYSSTPVFDIIPNSPASSDDKEYKAWKKSILMIYNRLTIHKNASIFLRPVTEDLAPNYKQIVHRPMDLQTIKKNIESGVIRTTAEFQRDVMLMCQNAIMYNETNNNVYNMAKEMWIDSVSVMETLIESVKKEATDRSSSSGNTSVSISKSRGRKSFRLT